VTRRRAVALAALLALGAAWEVTGPPPLPDFASVRARFATSEAVLLDRHGDVLHERRVDRNGRRLAWTPLREVSPVLVATLIETEDRRFRTRGGADALAVAAALRDACAQSRTGHGAHHAGRRAVDPSLRARPRSAGGLIASA
jgi:penicillin-binding protein 1C